MEARSDTRFKFPRALATGHGDESCCVMTWAFGLERLQTALEKNHATETTMEARTDSDNFQVRMQQ